VRKCDEMLFTGAAVTLSLTRKGEIYNELGHCNNCFVAIGLIRAHPCIASEFRQKRFVLAWRKMILWRHYPPASFLKWTEADFKFTRCADYNANNGGCVGMVVLADGTLQR